MPAPPTPTQTPGCLIGTSCFLFPIRTDLAIHRTRGHAPPQSRDKRRRSSGLHQKGLRPTRHWGHAHLPSRLNSSRAQVLQSTSSSQAGPVPRWLHPRHRFGLPEVAFPRASGEDALRWPRSYLSTIARCERAKTGSFSFDSSR